MSAILRIREEWKDMQKAADVVRDCYYALKHSGPDAASFRTLRANSHAYALTAQEVRILRRERKRAIRAALEEWQKEERSIMLRAINEQLMY